MVAVAYHLGVVDVSIPAQRAGEESVYPLFYILEFLVAAPVYLVVANVTPFEFSRNTFFTLARALSATTT